MNDLKYEREKAWKYYYKWRSEGSYSPALKSKVTISRKAWIHFSYKHKKPRPVKDIKRRYRLLPSAKLLIEKSNTIQNFRCVNNTNYLSLEALTKYENKIIKLKVVLIEDRIGNIIFYSVMSKELKLNKKAKCLTLSHIKSDGGVILE